MKYFLSYRANVVLSAAETAAAAAAAAAAFLQNQSIPRNFFGGYNYNYVCIILNTIDFKCIVKALPFI